MIVSTIEMFWANLEKSGLLGARQLAELRGTVTGGGGGDAAVQALARELIERGLVTPWQAGMLLKGHTAFFLGKYKLLHELGRGGMGAVFQAIQAPLGRIVAVKVMAEKLVRDVNAVARFHREIQAAAALNHPNIVAALDADRVHNTHFLVMEYADGESLEALVKREGALPAGTACEQIRQAALGLQHAFERGMAHRDIKPGNLLLTRAGDGRGVVKILDMGLARFTSESREDGELTTTGQVMGTPDYIAPEQARNTKSADTRSDIYSLGCTLFRLLTGRVPFPGENAIEKITARWTEPPPPLRSRLRDAPPELEAIVLKMMSLDPAERYQTPAEVAGALVPYSTNAAPPPHGATSLPAGVNSPFDPRSEAVVADFDPGLHKFLQDLAHEAARGEVVETVSTMDRDGGTLGPHGASALQDRLRSAKTRAGRKRLSRPENREQSTRRRWRLLAMVGAGLFAAGLGWWVWQASGLTRLVVEWPEAERGGGSAEIDGRTGPLAKSGELVYPGPPGKRTARLLRKGYEPVEQTWSLARGESLSFRPEWQMLTETARKQEWRSLAADVQAALAKFGKPPPPAIAEAVGDQRRRLIAFGQRWPHTAESRRAQTLLRRLPAAADALRRETIPEYELRAAAGASRAGAAPELVAIFGSSRLHHWGRVTGLAVHPEGKVVASSSMDNSVRLWDAVTGDEIHSLNGQQQYIFAAEFSLDGKTIAALSDYGAVTRWNVADGDQIDVVSLEPNAGHVWRALLGPDCRFAATIGEAPGVTVWDARTGQNRRTFAAPETISGDSDSPSSMAFRPDGTQIAVAGQGADGQGQVGIYEVETGAAVRTIPARQSDIQVSFATDDRLLTVGSGVARLWDAHTGDLLAVVERSAQRGIANARLAPDGTTLLTIHGDGTFGVGTLIGEKPDWVSPQAHFATRARIIDQAGRKWALGNDDGAVEIWEVASGEPRAVFPRMPVPLTVVPLPTGALASLEWDAGRVRLVEALSRRELWSVQRQFETMPVFAVASQGTSIALGGGLDPIVVYDATDGTTTCELTASEGIESRIAFSLADELIVAASGRNSLLRLWDARTGDIRHLDDPPAVSMNSLTFHPDGRRLAWSTGLGIALWDMRKQGQPRRLSANEFLWCLAFTGDGARLVTGDDWGCVKVRDSDTGAERQTIHPKLWSTCATNSIAVSPDGQLAAAAIGNGTVGVWQLENRFSQLLFHWQLGPPMGKFRAVWFTPDGRHVVAANTNGTIYLLRLKIWDPGETAPES